MTDPHLYVMYIREEPRYYAFGEPWVAMALYMDDIRWKTPKEAWDDYMRENRGKLTDEELTAARKTFEEEAKA